MIDHLDGHISDVYVFAVAAADAAPTLYHTPDLHKYDVKWEVTDWDVSQREVILDKEIRNKTSGEIRHEKIVAQIGTESLKLEPTE